MNKDKMAHNRTISATDAAWKRITDAAKREGIPKSRWILAACEEKLAKKAGQG